METKIANSVITQIGILTDDVENAKKQWEAILNQQPDGIHESEYYEQTQATYQGKPMHGRIRQVCFRMDNLELELIQPIGDEPSYWADCLHQNGPGIHHISFAVKNMNGAIDHFTGQGLKLTQKGEFPNGRYAYLDGMDSLHVVLELLEKDQEELS